VNAVFVMMPDVPVEYVLLTLDPVWLQREMVCKKQPSRFRLSRSLYNQSLQLQRESRMVMISGLSMTTLMMEIIKPM
jgi:hypothetical protein